MSQDWKKVYSSSELVKSSLVTGVLLENEIPAKTMDRKPSAFVFLGEVEVYVPAEFVEKAIALIQTLELSVVPE